MKHNQALPSLMPNFPIYRGKLPEVLNPLKLQHYRYSLTGSTFVLQRSIAISTPALRPLSVERFPEIFADVEEECLSQYLLDAADRQLLVSTPLGASGFSLYNQHR
jgi:hypothetical protein